MHYSGYLRLRNYVECSDHYIFGGKIYPVHFLMNTKQG